MSEQRRTVKNGRVHVAGKVYEPDGWHAAYDGRLDGMRCSFALYYRYPRLLALIGVVGYEAMQGPDCIDGAFPWYFWHEVEA